MSTSATVLLLHSFGSAGRSWSAVRDRLAGPSLAPDLPGFGEAPPLPQPSVRAYAEWVVQRLAETDGAVVLAGASMGGKIAMAAAALRPVGLRGLVLCAPSPPGGETMEPGERERQLASHGDAAGAAKSVEGSTLAPPGSPSFQRATEDWLSSDPSAWRWWWEAGSREEIDVSAIAAPVTVLVGDQDDHLGAAVQQRRTMPRLPGARLRSASDSGHLLALDRPDIVASTIAALAARAG